MFWRKHKYRPFISDQLRPQLFQKQLRVCREQELVSSRALLPRHPLLPVLRKFPWRRYSSRPLERQVAIPPRCEPPLPSACRALGLSVGVVGKFSQPVTLHSQDDLPDERDTRSAFPSHLSKVDVWRFRKKMYGEAFNWFSRTGYT
jgi:hypothetical protein